MVPSNRAWVVAVNLPHLSAITSQTELLSPPGSSLLRWVRGEEVTDVLRGRLHCAAACCCPQRTQTCLPRCPFLGMSLRVPLQRFQHISCICGVVHLATSQEFVMHLDMVEPPILSSCKTIGSCSTSPYSGDGSASGSGKSGAVPAMIWHWGWCRGSRAWV